MNRKRILGTGPVAVYHCVTRAVGGELLFGDKEKRVLRQMMMRVAAFSGVEVIAYVLMSNHFHVLVRVHQGAGEVDDAELIRRYRMLYPKPTKYQMADIAVLEDALRRNDEQGQRLRAQLQARMGDVSEYMKTLKQRFSIWFNSEHGRFGTLWAERFSSTLVEDTPAVLKTVAAYIDLNPVRAGLVDDPKDYRFCSYAEALAGDAWFAEQIAHFFSDLGQLDPLGAYRITLFGKGAAPKPDGSGSRLSEQAFREVLERGGTLSTAEMLRHKVVHFVRGGVLGSEAFVRPYLSVRRQTHPPAALNSLPGNPEIKLSKNVRSAVS